MPGSDRRGLVDRGRTNVTALLLEWQGGSQAALNQLVPLLYNDLRNIARRHLRGERSDRTLETAALVNEAYLRLVDHQQLRWQNRAHFLAVASHLMREVLVDHARRRHAKKRGGQALTVVGGDVAGTDRRREINVLALDEALDELERLAPRQHRIVEMKYFGGLSIEEIALVLDVSPGTVRRDWAMAKAFLYWRMT